MELSALCPHECLLSPLGWLQAANRQVFFISEEGAVLYILRECSLSTYCVPDAFIIPAPTTLFLFPLQSSLGFLGLKESLPLLTPAVRNAHQKQATSW